MCNYSFKKITLLFFVAFLQVMVVCAASITVQAPSHVANGEQFYLRYVVNTSDVKGFRLSSVPDAFDILMGPSTSTQSSFSMVNGRTSQSSSVTYTYVLQATKNGTFTIPPAKAMVEGANVSSQPAKIVVSGQAPQAQQGGGRSQQQAPAQRVDRAGSRISGNDLFIRVTANKKRVHEQEPVLLTYKVYTQVQLTQLEGKMPDLNGFHTQQVDLPQQKTLRPERVDGKLYNTTTWSQYVMFPQMAGKLEIPPLTFKGIVVQEDPNVDPFEAFFNGGSGYIEVKKEIIAPKVEIMVDPLPAKPAGFSGGVGHFSVQASLDKTTVKAGDPVSLRFIVNGTGNLKLIKEPEFSLPKDFDKYDAKLTDKTKLTAEGVTGSMIYDILIVPRNKGEYTIPELQFVYFDTTSDSYKTLKTNPMKLTVEAGSGKSGVTDYSQRNDNDIHEFSKGLTLKENFNDTFYGTIGYWCLTGFIMVVFVTLLWIFRKRALALNDVTAMRGKKANKVATKRLRVADKLMKQGRNNQFYDEVMRALWGYVSDKFAIPLEQLSKDTIQEVLQSKGIEQTVISSFIEALDECEFERYAPGDSAGNMQKTYDKASDAIEKIDEAYTMNKKKSNKISLIGVLMVMFFAAEVANAQVATDTTAAQTPTTKKNVALEISAQDYFQKGNEAFRHCDYAQAMLNYERARKLCPMNKDIEHNIEITRAKTIDRMPPESEMFFVKWYKGLVMTMTIDGWAYIALVSFIVALVLFLVYLFVDRVVIRVISFYGSLLLLFVFVIGNVFAWSRKYVLTTHDTAIITSEMVTVKSSPIQKAPDACIIHEGTFVRITDREMKGWYAIELSDGKEGWVSVNSLEEI